ncbi:uncharacterized protein HD556DRAFT_1536398 [Suillus plorans]|uniref:Uncharacterized protein n=1 Tax=Suillus plorans TaxID=116603 RepID=A0A9P7APX7_9AGAM|nr:uncharacterized protein HD556DRAFT_1536398 [Suillus plorans]KAG1793986.1 hypothetical protein HD556DRAFT_1536398 [Suillus plorans]
MKIEGAATVAGSTCEPTTTTWSIGSVRIGFDFTLEVEHVYSVHVITADFKPTPWAEEMTEYMCGQVRREIIDRSENFLGKSARHSRSALSDMLVLSVGIAGESPGFMLEERVGTPICTGTIMKGVQAQQNMTSGIKQQPEEVRLFTRHNKHNEHPTGSTHEGTIPSSTKLQHIYYASVRGMRWDDLILHRKTTSGAAMGNAAPVHNDGTRFEERSTLLPSDYLVGYHWKKRKESQSARDYHNSEISALPAIATMSTCTDIMIASWHPYT